MLHAGLDLSRRKIDVCLLSEQGGHLDQLAVPPDVERFERWLDESTRSTQSRSAPWSSR